MYRLVDDKAIVYREKDLNSPQVTEPVPGDVFKVLKTEDGTGATSWLHIELPDGRDGYTARDIKAIRFMDPKEVTRSVRQMQGVFALWGIMTEVAFVAMLGAGETSDSMPLVLGLSVCFWLTMILLGRRNASCHYLDRLALKG